MKSVIKSNRRTVFRSLWAQVCTEHGDGTGDGVGVMPCCRGRLNPKGIILDLEAEGKHYCIERERERQRQIDRQTDR